jgi:hypothetical protein
MVHNVPQMFKLILAPHIVSRGRRAIKLHPGFSFEEGKC